MPLRAAPPARLTAVRAGAAVAPVVEVRDRNDLPVAGASVTFLIEGGGRTATLANGLQQVTVTTDASGRAAVSSMSPAGRGALQIRIRASFLQASSAVGSSATWLGLAKEAR